MFARNDAQKYLTSPEPTRGRRAAQAEQRNERDLCTNRLVAASRDVTQKILRRNLRAMNAMALRRLVYDDDDDGDENERGIDER